MNEQQKKAAQDIERQGYNPKQAARMAKRMYPAQPRGKAAGRGAGTKTPARSKTSRGAGSTSAVTATKSSDAGPTSPRNRGSRQTPEGRARIAAASHTGNVMRWARVRALGLRNLKELAAYDAARKVLTS